MASRTVAFTVLVAVSAAAAAGGAYVALRQNAARPSQATSAIPAAIPLQAAASAEQGPVPAPAVTDPPAAMGAPAEGAESAGQPAARAAAPAETRAGRPVSRRTGSASGPVRAARRGESSTEAARPAEAPAPEPAAPAAASGVQPIDAPLPPATAPPLFEAIPAAEVTPQREVPPPAPREFVEVTVPADSVLGLQLETTVSSARARLEDRVEARVSRDLRVDGVLAVPAGSRAIGEVVLVEQGGKVKGRPRIGLRFHTLLLADGSRVQLATDTIYREGESPAGRSSARIGGAAIGGAIIGAILGGGKGAAVGSTVGAAGGTASVMAGDRPEVVVPSGTIVTARLQQPVTVIVEK